MPSGKREAAGFHELGALAAAQPEEIRTRRTAAETTYGNILSRLGAKGTYEQVGGAGPSLFGGAPGGDIFKTSKATSTQATAIDRRYSGEGAIGDITSLDPTAATRKVEGSAQFRIMSRLTAEAEQLIARKGPLYDEMKSSLQLPIIEGAGAMARENMEQLKRAAARGGSARRSAMEAVQRIRSQEKINSQKIIALSQSNFALDQWARTNAGSVLEMGRNFAANTEGVRESYNSAMDQASELMLNSALPIMFQAKADAAKWRYYAHQKKRAKLTRWIDGVVGVISMAAGAYAKSPELVGAGAGMIAGATGGPEAPTGGGSYI